MPNREIQTCTRCKDSKRRCDKNKPNCSRCLRAGQTCVYIEINESTSIEPMNGLLSPSTSNHSSPSERDPGPERTIKRRDRATLSCTRCHRMKIKCDKNQPCCGRCARLGYGGDCEYTHKVQPAQSSIKPFGVHADDPEAVLTLWFLRKRGASHWRVLLSRLESLSGLTEPPFLWASRSIQSHMLGSCGNKNIVLPGNFPFGSRESIPYRSALEVRALLEKHRQSAPTFMARYFTLYHSTQLFDAQKFEAEVDQFWLTPENFDLGWVALYLAILGLGATATGIEYKIFAEIFFASEACLIQTPFMFRPTVANIRTLLLHVQAKQVCYSTCWAFDSSWNLVGLIVRLSIMMGLHRCWIAEADEDPNIFEEREQRRCLWNSVAKMDIQISLVTGQASPLPMDALLSNAVDSIQGLPNNSSDIIAASYMLIYQILTRLNTSMEMIPYEQVLQYDTELRKVMRLAVSATENKGFVERTTTDIFFRRVLMILHRYYALHPDAPTSYSTSYWSSLECCLALIVHHRALSSSCHTLPDTIHLVARPFMLDFFAAALTTCIHLMSVDAPLSATISSESNIPPRRTILETIESCIEIFDRERTESLCFTSGHLLLYNVYKLIPKDLS